MSLRLINAFTGYIAALKSQVTPLVMETITLASAANKDYDLKTLFPAHADFNLLSARIEVKVKDVEVGSPTVNYFTNGEAFLTVGITNTGLVRIHNFHTAPVDAVIRISAPCKKLAA